MNPMQEHARQMTRRYLLGRTAGCLGAAGLASLIDPRSVSAAVSPIGGSLGTPHFAQPTMYSAFRSDLAEMRISASQSRRS